MLRSRPAYTRERGLMGGGGPDPLAGYALYLPFSAASPTYRVGATTYPPVEGPDLAVTSATAGWTATDATLSIVGGKLRVTSNGGPTPQAQKSGVAGTGNKVRMLGTMQASRSGFGQTLLEDGGGSALTVASGTGSTAVDSTRTGLGPLSLTLRVRDGGGTWGSVGDYVDYDLTAKVQPGVWQLPGYSYTRSGVKSELNASGSPIAFAVNEPGVVPGVGYWSRGTLTNLVLQSQALDNASWAKTSCTVTADAATAPDGTTTMDRIVASASGQSGVSQSIVVGATTTRTFSAFIPKSTGFAHVYLDISDNVANRGFLTMNRSTGVFGTLQNLAGAGISMTGYAVDCGTFWRAVFVWVTTTNTSPTIFFGPCDAANSRTCSSGNQDAWQLQDILGNHPAGGPIIPTAGATASIGADDLRLNNSLADADMLIWVKGNLPAAPAAVSHLLALDDGTLANFMNLTVYSGGGAQVQVISNSVTQINQYTGTVVAGGDIAIVLLRQGGNLRGGYIQSGVLTWLGAATAGSWPIGLSKADIGTLIGGNPTNGIVQGAYIKAGTYANDAAVLAAVAAT